MTASPLASAPVRQRVPSSAAKVIMFPVAFAAIACLLLGLGGGNDLLPSVPRFAWFAAVVVLFGVNFVVRQTLGYDVVVDELGIRESRRGGKKIAWTDKPKCSLSTVRIKQRRTPKAAAISAMTNATRIQTLAVATSDGRRIEVGLVFGSPLVAAVQRFSVVEQEIKGDG